MDVCHYIMMDVETQNLLPGLQDSRDKRHIRARHSPKKNARHPAKVVINECFKKDELGSFHLWNLPILRTITLVILVLKKFEWIYTTWEWSKKTSKQVGPSRFNVFSSVGCITTLQFMGINDQPSTFFPKFCLFHPITKWFFLPLMRTWNISPDGNITFEIVQANFMEQKTERFGRCFKYPPWWNLISIQRSSRTKKKSSVESFPFIYKWFEFSWCSSRHCCHLSLIPCNPSEKKYVQCTSFFLSPKDFGVLLSTPGKHRQFPPIQHIFFPQQNSQVKSRQHSAPDKHRPWGSALVVVNWRNQHFDSYTFGVPLVAVVTKRWDGIKCLQK